MYDRSLPVISSSGLEGLLHTGGRRNGAPYSWNEIQLLSAAANMAGTFLERRRLEESARQAETLKEGDKQKSAIFSSVSHELKTPLTALREGAELLAEQVVGPLTEEQREVTDILHNNALRLQKLEIWPMVTFKTANLRISVWFLVPVAIATGMLAATIAVGGFIGVPGLMYIVGATSIVASATELVIAFVMGLGGTLIWAYYGMVDIRLVLLILAGSLFGVQLGAIGTTYVKEYMIKYVMATIMLIVAVSRFFALPKYLSQLRMISLQENWIGLMTKASFAIMCLALVVGASIILFSLFKARRLERLSTVGV